MVDSEAVETAVVAVLNMEPLLVLRRLVSALVIDVVEPPADALDDAEGEPTRAIVGEHAQARDGGRGGIVSESDRDDPAAVLEAPVADAAADAPWLWMSSSPFDPVSDPLFSVPGRDVRRSARFWAESEVEERE